MTRQNENEESRSSESEAEEAGSLDSRSRKERKKKKKKKKKTQIDEAREERNSREEKKKRKKNRYESDEKSETSEERRERRRLKKERKERRAQRKDGKERKEGKNEEEKIGEFSFERKSKRKIDYENDHCRPIPQKSEIRGKGDDPMELVIKERSRWEVWYRRILLLPANPELDTPIKRYLRCLSWTMLFFDMTAAIVSLVTFGDITYCCEEPLLNMVGDNVDWNACVRGVIYVYLILLVLEIYPVVRQGFPFNIVNPIIGFIITFAVFFDDAKTEALIMWALETMAVLCEFALYRLKVYQSKKRAIEIKELMPKTTRKVGDTYDTYDDEEAAAMELKTARRKFYVLRKEQAKDVRMLRWLVFAVYLNFVLTSTVLVLILVIARSGGLCFENFRFPNVFHVDQIGNCFMCSDPGEECHICTDEIIQCYYPYV